MTLIETSAVNSVHASVMEEMRSDWQRQETVHLEKYLARLTEEEQADLFPDLLALELELWRQRGTTPQLTEYLQRFPEVGLVVRAVFQRLFPEQLSGSQGPKQDTAANGADTTLAQNKAPTSVAHAADPADTGGALASNLITVAQHSDSASFSRQPGSGSKNKSETDTHLEESTQKSRAMGERGPTQPIPEPKGQMVAPPLPQMGQMIGNYTLLAEIARGGMGVVFKAQQAGLDRLVALKMILSGTYANPSQIARFQGEARAAAQLDHPGIVPIYDFGQHEGHPFFTMAYVDGQSLAQLIRKQGPIEIAQAVDWMIQIAEAVDYAHQFYIVHRDLKPANILIDAANRPRVTDFGLAKRLDTNSEITNPDQVVGTPSYMAPEQAQARHGEVGPAADIYSLGAIMYSMLAGRAVFVGSTALETLMHVVHSEPEPLPKLNTRVPASLDRIIQRCLKKTPSDRYTTASQLANELRAWREQNPKLRVVRSWWQQAWITRTWVAAACVALFLWAAWLSASIRSAAVSPKEGNGLVVALPSTTPQLSPATITTTVAVPAPQLSLPEPTNPTPALTPTEVVAGSSAGANTRPTNPKPATPTRLLPQANLDSDLQNRPLRTDFDVQCVLTDGNVAQDGVVHWQDGQPIGIEIQVAEQAYVGAWAIMADGGILQLFPNRFDTNHLVDANNMKRLPSKTTYQIIATPSTGIEYVHVVASTHYWAPATGEQVGPKSAYSLFASAKDRGRWQQQMRGLVLASNDTPAPNPTTPATEPSGPRKVAEIIIPFFVDAHP